MYPLWKYHPEHPDGVIVRSAEHMEKLGPGWVDSASLFPAPKAPYEMHTAENGENPCAQAESFVEAAPAPVAIPVEGKTAKPRKPRAQV